ncbi:MAG: T9SS type A sorting domain-containing protein [bacterium]
MNISKIFQQATGVVLVLLLMKSPIMTAQENTEFERSKPLTKLTNPETLNLKKSYNSRLYIQNSERISNSSEQQFSGWAKEKKDKSSSYSLMFDPDDVYWDDRFDQLGIDGTVLAIAVNGSDFYVGGSFSMAGDVSANNIAKWDGNSWSVLGSGANNGTNGTVLAIAVSGSEVFVGGNFSSAGGITVNNIAKWDGNSWSALGSGISNGDVRAIAVSSNDLYVGGVFTTAGEGNANNIAKWNGSIWEALSSGANNGVDGPVYAISITGSEVYVGGSFTSAGGESANNIALWDSSTNTWTTLGSGVSLGDVNAIVISGAEVYAGGLFNKAGGANAKKIAKWDGNSWSALGNGISGGDINAIAVMENELYVGGSFTTAGNDSANKIAKWNGSSWSALGSGIDGGIVFAIAISSSNVYVGGSFTTAGGKTSEKFARWFKQDGSVPIELISFSAITHGHLVELHWETATETNNYGFEIERMAMDSSLLIAEEDNITQLPNNQWEMIAFVAGQGTSNEPHSYTYREDVQSLIHFSAQTLLYRLKQIDLNGTFEYYKPIEVRIGILPNKIVLGQNYPNPFNPQTVIEFTIPNNGFTTLKVYNMLGQEVRSLVKENLEAGVVYKVKFDASTLPTGLYYYTLRSGNMIETKKMLLMK